MNRLLHVDEVRSDHADDRERHVVDADSGATAVQPLARNSMRTA